jgi:transposase-like protein
MKAKVSINRPVIETNEPRRKFDRAFKQRAVELWLSSGRTATEVARELGFESQRLYAWKERFAPNNWKPKTPACGARTNICANSGIF